MNRTRTRTRSWPAKARGKEAKLSYNGNLLVENRNGLIVNTEVFEANNAERNAAQLMGNRLRVRKVTVGADKTYETQEIRGRVTKPEKRRQCRHKVRGSQTAHQAGIATLAIEL